MYDKNEKAGGVCTSEDIGQGDWVNDGVQVRAADDMCHSARDAQRLPWRCLPLSLGRCRRVCVCVCVCVDYKGGSGAGGGGLRPAEGQRERESGLMFILQGTSTVLLASSLLSLLRSLLFSPFVSLSLYISLSLSPSLH